MMVIFVKMRSTDSCPLLADMTVVLLYTELKKCTCKNVPYIFFCYTLIWMNFPITKTVQYLLVHTVVCSGRSVIIYMTVHLKIIHTEINNGFIKKCLH